MTRNNKNSLAIGIYAITAILYFITMIISCKSVSENLDGWHGFKSGHVSVFIIICLLLIGGCLYNITGLLKDKVNKGTFSIGAVLIVLPFIFHIISISLAGNVDTDFQYLILRTFQGFDPTFLYLIITSIVGYIFLLRQKFIGNSMTNNQDYKNS